MILNACLLLLLLILIVGVALVGCRSSCDSSRAYFTECPPGSKDCSKVTCIPITQNTPGNCGVEECCDCSRACNPGEDAPDPMSTCKAFTDGPFQGCLIPS